MIISSLLAGLSPRRIRSVLAFAALAATSFASVGCLCGAAAVPTGPGEENGARVEADGTVVYDNTRIGDSVSFAIPVKDTADVDETLIGAHIAGPDADEFEIHAKFPIAMPAGVAVHVEVEFHPNRSGEASADLMIDTEDMGASEPIELTGFGEDPEGA